MTAPATTNEAVEELLTKLRSVLGMTEQPDGSNNNAIVQWYNANVAKIGLGPWCQMTVTWALYNCGFKVLFPGTAWTVQAAKNAIAKEAGMVWHEGTSGLLAGDLVYYDWTGSGSVDRIDHVGTVEKVNSDGTFYAIEGNASNAVRRMHRDSKYVVGHIRLNWPAVVKAPVAKPPVAAPKPSAPTQAPEAKNDVPRIKAIQALLDVAEDGVWGPKTDTAFLNARRQKTLNADQIKKLQLAVGVTQDGIWGPNTDEAALTLRKRVIRR